MTIDRSAVYWVMGEDLALLDTVRKRLYTEKTLNADEMRDLAHKLTIVLDHMTREEAR